MEKNVHVSEMISFSFHPWCPDWTTNSQAMDGFLLAPDFNKQFIVRAVQ